MYTKVSDHAKSPQYLQIPRVNNDSKKWATQIPINILSIPSFPFNASLIQELQGPRFVEILILHNTKTIPTKRKKTVQLTDWIKVGISVPGEVYDTSAFYKY
jgi:hypothetical protein